MEGLQKHQEHNESLEAYRVTNEEREMIFDIFKEDGRKNMGFRRTLKIFRRYMKRFFTLMLIMVLFTGCGNKAPDFSAIQDAETITVKEVAVSVGKKYKIYADGEQIGYVKGKALKLWEDKFEIYDMNGEKIMEEKEVKRIVRLNRMAEIRDTEKKVIGYIGEQTLSKMFSIGHTFHFYDGEKKPIGISDEVNISLLKKNNFKDNEGNTDYKVSAKFDLFDVYDIEVKDGDSSIPPEFAVLMVCIEDSIKDAEEKEKKEEKNKNSN